MTSELSHSRQLFDFAELFDPWGIETLSHFPALLLLIEILALLWVAKKVFAWLHPFALDYQLVKVDNKAVTLAFVGYLAGVAIILEGVAEGPWRGVGQNLLEMALWGIIGILLLNLAGKLNDLWILRGIDNKKELVERSNLAVAAAEAGSFIGSAFLIRSVVAGESLGWVLDLSLTLGYFFLAQLGFVLFGYLYDKITRFDLLKELAEGNIAVGISLGMNLAALGGLLAIPLRLSYSLLLFSAWFIVGAAVLGFFRFVMDRVIIPTEKLDSEIHQDQNWGIALLEGSFALMALLFLQVLFTP